MFIMNNQFIAALFSLNSPFVNVAVIDFVIQWVGFIIAFLFKTEKFYDLTGSMTFILVSCLYYNWTSVGHPRQYIQISCICIWALRLGLFLFTRILKSGKDRRFDVIKTNTVRFFSAWTIQGIWVLITLVPSLVSIGNPRQRPLSYRDYVGWSIWIFGFMFEIVADYQKSSFRNNPANNDKFIHHGLWSISRHPNYFGEILLWFGLYVSASSNFQSSQYFTILCPVFNYLLISQLSGIPPLEKYGARKWGRLYQYNDYIRQTPVLIPFLPQ